MMVFELYILSNMVFILGIHVCFGGVYFFVAHLTSTWWVSEGIFPWSHFSCLEVAERFRSFTRIDNISHYIKSSFWQPKQCESSLTTKSQQNQLVTSTMELKWIWIQPCFFWRRPLFWWGCFKYVLFSPLFGEDEPNLTNIFQMGWNHQLARYTPNHPF